MPRRRTVVREERFTLLLTEAEREKLDRLAAVAGVDRSTYVRLAVFGLQQGMTIVPLRQTQEITRT